jgi:Flp pilus assembly protein TadD
MICHNNIFYLIKFLWPADQTPHYLMPQPLGLSNPWILAGVGGTILLVLVLALTLRRTPAVAVCWLIYFLALLPTMQIVGFTNVAASDKYVYFPSIGLLMLLTYGCVQVLQKVRHRRLGGAVLAVLAIGLATVEARATRTYLAVWRDTESLYRHMIAHAPRAAWLISNLGNELLDQGRVDEAIEIHRRAVALTADQPAIHNDLGNALRAKGLLDEAMAQYRIALGLFPEYAVGHRNLGVALADQGRFAEAVSHLETAAALEPRRAETKACLASAHMNWAISLDRIGRSADALPHFQVAIALNPDDAEARYNLAQALRAHGRPAEAAEHMREALRRNPNDPDAREILDELLREQGNDPSSKAP